MTGREKFYCIHVEPHKGMRPDGAYGGLATTKADLKAMAAFLGAMADEMMPAGSYTIGTLQLRIDAYEALETSDSG